MAPKVMTQVDLTVPKLWLLLQWLKLFYFICCLKRERSLLNGYVILSKTHRFINQLVEAT